MLLLGGLKNTSVANCWPCLRILGQHREFFALKGFCPGYRSLVVLKPRRDSFPRPSAALLAREDYGQYMGLNIAAFDLPAGKMLSGTGDHLSTRGGDCCTVNFESLLLVHALCCNFFLSFMLSWHTALEQSADMHMIETKFQQVNPSTTMQSSSADTSRCTYCWATTITSDVRTVNSGVLRSGGQGDDLVHQRLGWQARGLLSVP